MAYSRSDSLGPLCPGGESQATCNLRNFTHPGCLGSVAPVASGISAQEGAHVLGLGASAEDRPSPSCVWRLRVGKDLLYCFRMSHMLLYLGKADMVFFFFFSLSFIRVAMHRVLWKKPQAFFPSDSSQGTVSWSHKECKMSLEGAPPSPWELKMCVCAFQL